MLSGFELYPRWVPLIEEYLLRFIQLFGRIRSTICLRMQTGNELMLCQLEAQVLDQQALRYFAWILRWSLP